MRRLLTSHDLSLRLLSAVGRRNEFEYEEEQGVSEGDINDGVSENFTQSECRGVLRHCAAAAQDVRNFKGRGARSSSWVPSW